MDWWVENPDGKWMSDRLRLNPYYLGDLICYLQRHKKLGGNKELRLTREETLLLNALVLVEQSYDRRDAYITREDKVRTAKEESRQLSEQLLEVTKERDELLGKIEEDKIQSGLFIKYVRDKFKI